ncbi:MAG: glutamine--fructose-6-phosphate transaminase (isomerizing) [Dehalogenimonas sp.]
MCGIVGYVGDKKAQPVLMETLARLEYRGYDSCGVAIRGSPLTVYKGADRVGHLEANSPLVSGTIGIGHTRWATHGEVSEANAHPHTDCRQKIAVVHNGVISNYQELKKQLTNEGHIFVSETDTEVLPHLIEKYYEGDIEKAVKQALDEVQGNYAILVVTEYENRMVAARNGNPLIIGIGPDGFITASDVPAVLNYAQKIIYLEDNDLAVMGRDGLKITNGGVEVRREAYDSLWALEDLGKNGYEHHMLKEISEQPRVVQNCLQQYNIKERAYPDAPPVLDGDTRNLTLIACGTSYHAALVGKYIIEELTGIPVRVEVASEISHRRHLVATSKVIGLSQSGETADVLVSLKRMRDQGAETVAITNVFKSTISRIADQTIYTAAGPEVAVAATKTFIAQLVALIKLALSHPEVDPVIRGRLEAELEHLPRKIQEIIDNKDQIARYAECLAAVSQVFFIAKGINVPIAYEGALKVKEIAYLNAEGYCAGELKHGPFALLTPDSMVVALLPRDENYEAMSITIQEIRARKARLLCLVEAGDDALDGADYALKLPPTLDLLSPILNAVALQLLAYYTAKARSCPIDFPRNLAKSVTVE